MTDSLTLYISCPCGYCEHIKGARQNDPDHAKQLARERKWHFPRINTGPLMHGMVVAEGVCDECYELERE